MGKPQRRFTTRAQRKPSRDAQVLSHEGGFGGGRSEALSIEEPHGADRRGVDVDQGCLGVLVHGPAGRRAWTVAAAWRERSLFPARRLLWSRDGRFPAPRLAGRTEEPTDRQTSESPAHALDRCTHLLHALKSGRVCEPRSLPSMQASASASDDVQRRYGGR